LHRLGPCRSSPPSRAKLARLARAVIGSVPGGGVIVS
jgi:hypothetical protein